MMKITAAIAISALARVLREDAGSDVEDCGRTVNTRNVLKKSEGEAMGAGAGVEVNWVVLSCAEVCLAISA